jgi:hypothetical protein
LTCLAFFFGGCVGAGRVMVVAVVDFFGLEGFFFFLSAIEGVGVEWWRWLPWE